MKNLTAGFLIAFLTFAPTFAFAEDQATVHFKVYSSTDTLFSGDVTVHPCPEKPESPTTTLNGFCIFEAAGVATEGTWYDSMGYAANTIQGVASAPTDWWQLFVNGTMSDVGISSVTPHDGDTILWTTGREPMRITVSSTSPQIGATTTVTVTGFNIANYPATMDPIAGATVTVGETNYSSDAEGHVDFVPLSTSTITISATAIGFIPSDSITVTPIESIIPVSEGTSTSATTTASTTPETQTPPAGGGGGGITHKNINIPRAISYLIGMQHPDGSFGGSIYTDWAAIGLALVDAGTAKKTLRTYLTSATPILASVTDYERHAMALEAMGINPYIGTPIDYIAPIVAAFDGTQVGDTSLVNDDIFALPSLLHAGYSADDVLVQKVVAHIVGKQGADGSWDNSPDMTAAAVQALAPLSSIAGVSDALSKASTYLHKQQHTDGGFGNSFTTSWVTQAIHSLGEQPSQSAWMPSDSNPQDYLASLQDTDGGIDSATTDKDSRIWATSYAIPAASGKVWHDILNSFPKNTSATTTNTSSGGAYVTPTGTTTATTTPEIVATSTEALDTSTSSTTEQTASTSTTPLVIENPTSTPATSTKPIIKKTGFVTSPKKKSVAVTAPQNTATTATSEVIQTPNNSSKTQVAAAAKPGFFGKIWKFITSLF